MLAILLLHNKEIQQVIKKNLKIKYFPLSVFANFGGKNNLE